MVEKRYAVLVGCSNYPEEPEKLPPLKCAESDATRLRELLLDKDIGGFDPDNALLFTNQPSYEVLKGIAKCLDQAERDDLVFIYFSGHGKLDTGNKLHLATSNTTVDLLAATSLPVAMIKEIIDKSKSQKIIWILDCCYSGAVGALFKGGDVDTELQIASGGKGKYIMTASTGIQASEEKEGEDYSLFTKYLLQGLKSGDADLDGDGTITVDELYSYVRDQVTQSGKQEPMKFAIGVTGDLVIAGARQLQKQRERCLAELYANGDISLDEYYFAAAIVTSSGPFTDEQNKLIEVVDWVTKGGDASLLFVLIRTLRAKEVEERKREHKERAESYRHKDMYREAVEEWEEVLKIDPNDAEALREQKELTRIIEKEQKIKDSASSAEEYFEQRKHLDAIVQWVEVLRLDPESDRAINGIDRNLETIKREVSTPRTRRKRETTKR